MNNWYEASTGNHQGLVSEEGTGRDVAVTYDKADAALVAAAPRLAVLLFAALKQESDSRKPWVREARGLFCEIPTPGPLDLEREGVAA